MVVTEEEAGFLQGNIVYQVCIYVPLCKDRQLIINWPSTYLVKYSGSFKGAQKRHSRI